MQKTGVGYAATLKIDTNLDRTFNNNWKIIKKSGQAAKQKMKLYADNRSNTKPLNIAEDFVLLQNRWRNNQLEVIKLALYKVIKVYKLSVKLQNNAGKEYQSRKTT